jgi:hypothetical protein
MARAQMQSDWRDEPATEGQLLKLLVMLKNNGLFGENSRYEDLWKYEHEAADWVNENVILERDITSIRDLTKGDMDKVFREIE